MRYLKAALIGLVLGLTLIAGVSLTVPKYVPINSVVRITNGTMTGSGAIVECWQDDSGFYSAKIYTVAHLIVTSDDTPDIEVFYPAGGSRKFPSTLIHYNKRIDFAVLLIDHMVRELPVLKVANLKTFYREHKSNDPIFLIGCGLGHIPFIKSGKINWLKNERGRINEQFISIDCHAIFGDSGGAVLNERGELIGLLSSVSVVRMGFFEFPHKEIAYVVPITLARESLDLVQ